jgi:FkbM family methyltransferase
MAISEFVYSVLLKPPVLRRITNATIKGVLPKTVRVGDAIIWINPNDPVVSGALTFQVYERNEIAFVRSHFGPDMTLIDVGANVGLYTGIALSVPGFQGTILAIEPHSESRSYLYKTIQSNTGVHGRGNVMVCDKAASDRSETLKLYMNAQNKGDNRLYPDALLDEAQVVAADTLDNICLRYGVESVDMFKVDVQGAEAKVISGATNLLNNSADCMLMTEFWPYGLSQAGSNPLDYLQSLGKLGFTLYELPKNGKRIIPIDDAPDLIARTPNRNYVNVLGLKGRSKRIVE